MPKMITQLLSDAPKSASEPRRPVRQIVNAAFNAHEPARHSWAEFSVRRARSLQFQDRTRLRRQGAAQSECFLAIGGHDRGSGASAHDGITLPTAVLVNEQRATLRIAARAANGWPALQD